ncbi:ABC transporter permease [Bifidobacterium sp.]|jgi:ABC-2 type transport system permease protein|uniref:ABC transporter permease n=1 Tax=Bifidobacterium sp. TaxID=41200 RepID=UPI0025C2F9B3|nr:ABC transporter permease [Bifidobacterium sp.]MCH4209991.1 ABC transporter permease [Bifidobacterium sp.]
MAQYLKASLVFGLTQIKRSFRDPMTLLVLFAIPLLLLIVFGSFLRDTSTISLRVAVVNSSQEQFAAEFAGNLAELEVLKLPDKAPTLDEAKRQMNEGELDGIIELPPEFGARSDAGMPGGTVKVYYDAADAQTGDIVTSIMRGVVDRSNKQITGITLPLDIVREPVNVVQMTAMDSIFPMFTGMAIMMVGLFGVASVIPYDKKGGYLRRLHATPMRPGQFMLGTMLNYAVIGLAVVSLMTVLAATLFGMSMRGNWLVYGAFIAASLLMILGFGLAVGGIAKNTTQADILGQIIFLGSLALGGIWFPRALMPEFIQGIVRFMPLTPVIDGIRAIVVENASLLGLGTELAVMAGWAALAYTVGIKLFRWE